jgi:putative transposase
MKGGNSFEKLAKTAAFLIYLFYNYQYNMLIRKAYRYRLYPTSDQEQDFAHNFGQARFVYNHFLAERKAFHDAHKNDEKKGLTYNDNANALKSLKKDPEYVWLKIAHSQVLQQSLKDLDQSYQNFFTKRAKFPKFHKKTDKQSARYMQYVFVGDGWIDFPKIGKVKAVIHRPYEGKVKNVTVIKTKSGRYFASVQVEVDVPEPEFDRDDVTVGIDMGLKDFVITSDAVKIPAPKHLHKSQKRLTLLQRRLSRSQKGSKGREKARLGVARQHEKIANQRSDFLHKTSTWLVRNYGLIGIENLNVCGMVENHKLARAISDASWGEFKRQLLYKGQWYGSRIVVIDRFYPSSRECSSCHHVLPELKLSVRQWNCPVCGAQHDRDHNAAINIENEAKTRAGTARSNAGGEDVRPVVKSWQSSLKSEEAAWSLA